MALCRPGNEWLTANVFSASAGSTVAGTLRLFRAADNLEEESDRKMSKNIIIIFNILGSRRGGSKQKDTFMIKNEIKQRYNY